MRQHFMLSGRLSLNPDDAQNTLLAPSSCPTNGAVLTPSAKSSSSSVQLHSFFSSFSSRGGLRFLAHRLSPHLDRMGIVHQAVEDAVGDRGIADLFVPARDWQLGSEDGGASLIAILADFPHFAPLGFLQRSHGPVIHDQDIDASQSCEEVA